jgi:hypothetical protein
VKISVKQEMVLSEQEMVLIEEVMFAILFL